MFHQLPNNLKYTTKLILFPKSRKILSSNVMKVDKKLNRLIDIVAANKLLEDS